MNTLLLNPTEHTPKILFDPDRSHFEISGISRPEDVRDFYYPVMDWLKEFNREILENKSYSYPTDHPATLKILLVYFNSSSAKFLYDIIEQFNILKGNGSCIRIEWYYHEGDIDLKEAGEEMSEMVKIPFEFIEQRE